MRKIPTINCSKEEVISQLNNQFFSKGVEAVICSTDQPQTLDKIFIDSCSRQLSTMSDNKLEKVKRLYQMQLENTVEPLALICASGTIVGYRMFHPERYLTLEKAVLSRKQRITAMRNSQETLEEFTRRNLIYSDIKGDNILVNSITGDIIFCDMDNICMPDLPTDVKPFELQLFCEAYGEFDKNAQVYMHNLLTLQQLGFKDYIPPHYRDVLLSLKKGQIPTGFKQNATPIIESMLDPQNFNGEYIAKYIKR